MEEVRVGGLSNDSTVERRSRLTIADPLIVSLACHAAFSTTKRLAAMGMEGRRWNCGGISELDIVRCGASPLQSMICLRERRSVGDNGSGPGGPYVSCQD